jgi:hypothetical protein
VLPISFTLTKGKVRALSFDVIEKCEDEQPPLNLTMHFSRPTPLSTGAKRTSFIARPPHATTDETVVGNIKGGRANGLLQSLLTVNGKGQPDPNGDVFCWASSLHWHATRKAG